MIRRVALIISELRPGGAERVVVHLAQGLRQLGVESGIVCLQQPGELAEEATTAGVPVTCLGSRRGYDVAAIISLAHAFRRLRPDVINVHDRASLPYTVIANRLAGRRPVILSCHGLLLHDRGARRFRDAFFSRDVQAMTAVSNQSAKEYADILGWAGQVEVLRNGVSLVKRDPELAGSVRRELGLGPDIVVLLAVGNVKPEKGFEDLLAAASRLRDAGGRPFVVLIAGAMDGGDYGRRLQTLHSDLRLGQTVRFLGRRRDTASLYSAADMFVLSSRTEGLPMALLEAMSAGLAVVGTRVGAVPEVLGQGCGILVSPGNVEELAAAMRQLLVDDLLRTRLGETGRQVVARDYSVTRMAEEYLRVYGQACSELRGHADGARWAQAGCFRPRVLMLGPLPPLTGGMATVVSNLSRSSLTRSCWLRTMNNGKVTPERRSLAAGAWSQLSLFGRLVWAVARDRAQIVHIHTCALFTFWRDMLHVAAFRALGAEVVWHIHDGSFVPFLAGQPPFRKSILRRALKAGAAAIVLSDTAAAGVRPLAPDVRWRVVPNSVPMPLDLAPMNNGAPRFLFIGNLTRRKGAYDLVDAFAAASRRGGFAARAFLAGGETDLGQKEELLTYIDQSGCTGSIELLGLVHGQQKHSVLSGADCLVLPSYAEGLPMVVLEGMSYGLPIIASHVGAIPEVVRDGTEGFILSPGDVPGLANRIALLAADPALRRRMGQAARRRVEERYSMEVACEAILGIYREAMSRRNEVREA